MTKIKPKDKGEVRRVRTGIEFPRTSIFSDDRRFDVKPKQKQRSPVV